jgi:GNAT superfamily N-acetyltransferase
VSLFSSGARRDDPFPRSAVPTMTMLIRPAVLSDAAALGRVHVAAWRVAYPHLLPARVLDALSEEERARRWEGILSTSAAGTLIAEFDGALAGFASIGESRDPDAVPGRTGELYALYVAPEWWSRGMGWGLWAAARQRLLDTGFEEATLWVLEGNARARRFYEQAGLALDPGAVQSVEIDGVKLPEVRYRCRLDPAR